LIIERASAIVFQGIHRRNGQMVAIKIMTPDDDGDFDIKIIQSEVDFLREFSSPYIVSCLEGFHFENNVWVIHFLGLDLTLSSLFFNTAPVGQLLTAFASSIDHPTK
jgi:serine/threonine protein kinase